MFKISLVVFIFLSVFVTSLILLKKKVAKESVSSKSLPSIETVTKNYGWQGNPGENEADVSGSQGVPDGKVDMADLNFLISKGVK